MLTTAGKRILIVVMGSLGDVAPLVAVGQGFQRRGHMITLLSFPRFQSLASESGFSFLPLKGQERFNELFRDPSLSHPIRGTIATTMMLIDLMRYNSEGAIQACQGVQPAIVLRYQLAFGVRAACETLGMQCVTAASTPVLWLSRDDPGWAGYLPAGGRVSREWIVRRTFPKALNMVTQATDAYYELVQKQNADKVEEGFFLKEMQGGFLNLGLWSALFRRPEADDPGNTVTCGFPWLQHKPADSPLQEFLQRRGPLVVFTLGTSGGGDQNRFFHEGFAACKQLGYRALVLGTEIPAPPDNVRSVRFFPIEAALPHASVLVHHGGIGFTAHALRAGVPSVVIPHFFDQPYNAYHAKRHGAAVTIRLGAFNCESLTAALKTMVSGENGRQEFRVLTRRLAQELNGADVAAQIIERTMMQSDKTPEKH